MRVAVLSDTHAPRHWKRCPAAVAEVLRGADAILHARLRLLFPTQDLVVFGHSHIPWDETYDGQRHFNPGSPSDRRRQPHGTMGELMIDGGALVSARIFPVT